jgi:hypothetical protein
MEERRRSRRAAPADEISIMIGGNRPAKVVDVSPSGAHLELASALNPRGECRLSLPLPNGILRLKARVVHCKLTGFSSTGEKNQLVYHAGVEFVDIDPKLAKSISLAYPPPVSKPVRTGPIKVKVNVDALEHAAQEGEHGAN